MRTHTRVGKNKGRTTDTADTTDMGQKRRYTRESHCFRAEIEVTFQPGHTKTGGRKPGVANKRTRRFNSEVAESGTTPLEHMLAVLHDPKADADRRDRMAVAAAPFVHPRLAVVDSRVVAEVKVPSMTEAERREQARALIRAAFAERPMIDVTPKVIAGRDVNADVSAQANDEQKPDE